MSAAAISGSNTGLIPQPHGGALRTGGTKGRSGRRPDRIRKLAQKALEKRIPLLEAFADGVAVQQSDVDGTRSFDLISPTPRERIAAMAELGKLAASPAVNATDVRDRLRAQVTLILSRESWQSEELLTAIQEIWR